MYSEHCDCVYIVLKIGYVYTMNECIYTMYIQYTMYIKNKLYTLYSNYNNYNITIYNII